MLQIICTIIATALAPADFGACIFFLGVCTWF